MKVVWYVNIPFPDVRERLNLPPSGSGYWMIELAKALQTVKGFELVICWSGRIAKSFSFKRNTIQYYCLKESRYEEYGIVSNRLLGAWAQIMMVEKPDLVEYHGTEKYYGLLTKYLSIPTLVDIQGILSSCRKVFWGPLKLTARVRYHALLKTYISYLIRSFSEKRIIQINKNFVGRTKWDCETVKSISYDAVNYYHCPRIIRKEFTNSEWHATNNSNVTYVAIANDKPLKGANNIIMASKYLMTKGYRFIVNVIGGKGDSEYGRYLHDLVSKHSLSTHITFYPYLPVESIVNLYMKSDAFILSSYMENSPNSLAEAMCLGMPVIASDVGGVGSMVENAVDGYLFSLDEPNGLGRVMENIARNRKKDTQIGRRARERALYVHNEQTILASMIKIYEQVLGDEPPRVIRGF